MRIVATVDISCASAAARNVGIITKGMKGVAVHIQYGDGWEGLVRNVVFSGAEERTIVDAGPVVAIPPEVLAIANINLRIGVCGVGDDGETVIPTVWADLGNVRTSAAGVFPLPDAITPDVAAQILSMIGSLPDLETQDKGSLVAAINEVLRNGGSGASIEIDNSLTKEGQAADAKAVGDKFTEIEEGLNGIVGDIAQKLQEIFPVTISGNTASHSASEIKAAMASGKYPAIATDTFWAPMSRVSETGVVFEQFAYVYDEESIITITIDNQKNVTVTTAYPSDDHSEQADWSQNDPEQPNYVKNRTHWEELIGEKFFSETAIIPEALAAGLKTPDKLKTNVHKHMVEGATYTVVFNGVSYVCVCQKCETQHTNYVATRWVLGNTDMLRSSVESMYGGLDKVNSDWPFAFEAYTISTASDSEGWWAVWFPGDGPRTATVEVYKGEHVVHQIDEKFIPDTIARKTDIPEGLPEATAENEGKVLGVVGGEWKPVDAPAGAGSSVQPDLLQNDPEQPDYVKNRTHWEELDVRTVCTWDGNTEGLEQFELAGMTFYKRTTEANPPTLDALYGCEIRTIENGVQKEVSLIGSEFDNVVEANSELGAVNCCFVGHFMVVYDTEFSIMGETHTVSSPGIWVMPTFRVLRYGEVIVHTLAEKFIPGSIARTREIPQTVKELISTEIAGSGFQTAEQVLAIVNQQLGVIEHGTY